MKIIYGTGNPAKLMYMKHRLNGLNIELVSLNELDVNLDIDESGRNPAQNARIKAMAYYNALKLPVFSADSGLYIDGLEENRQPGVHVRRVNGKVLNDDEMIEYYTSIASEMGGQAIAHYENALCFIIDENHIYEHVENAGLMCDKFIISNEVHSKRNPGFPIDSISKRIDTGEFYYDQWEDITKNKNDEEDMNSDPYRCFIIKSLEDYNQD